MYRHPQHMLREPASLNMRVLYRRPQGETLTGTLVEPNGGAWLQRQCGNPGVTQRERGNVGGARKCSVGRLRVSVLHRLDQIAAERLVDDGSIGV